MTRMNITIIIILAIIIIGGVFLFKGRISKSSPTSIATPTDSAKKPYMTVEEAEKIVERLESLGYYKYADTNNLDTLKKDLISSLAEYGVLSTVYNEKNFIPLDNRLFLFDGETLFEQDGFTDAIKNMRPLFR